MAGIYLRTYETIVKTVAISLALILFFDLDSLPFFVNLNSVMLANEFLGFTWKDIFLSVIYLAVFSLFAMKVLGEKINPVFKYISGYHLPEEMKDTFIDKIDDFAAPGIDATDLLKTLSTKERIHHSSSQTYSSELIFSLNAANDAIQYVSDFAIRTYFILSFNAPFSSSMKHISYYSLTKIQAGYLETFFSNDRLTISLNDSVLGHFDYRKRELCDSNGVVKGTFHNPERFVLRMPFYSGVDSSVYIGNKKTADINISPSTMMQIKEKMASSRGDDNSEITLFENLDVRSEWEAYMLLGFAISEYALARTLFRRSSRFRRSSSIRL